MRNCTRNHTENLPCLKRSSCLWVKTLSKAQHAQWILNKVEIVSIVEIVAISVKSDFSKVLRNLIVTVVKHV